MAQLRVPCAAIHVLHLVKCQTLRLETTAVNRPCVRCEYPHDEHMKRQREPPTAISPNASETSGRRSREQQVIEADLTWTGKAFEAGVKVVVNAHGRIEAVGCHISAPTTHRLKDRALLPGLVNAHSHAFQRGLRGRGETYPVASGVNSFWTWRQEMYKLVESLDAESFYRLSRQCFEEMRSSGITTVGEFHYFHHGSPSDEGAPLFAFDALVIKAARDAGVRLILLNAFYAFGGFEHAPLSASQQRFKTASLPAFWANLTELSHLLDSTRGEALGVVAHSMRAVDVPTIVALHEEARRRGMVFHMHVEEQPKEIEDCVAALGKPPMAILLASLQIDDKFTAVHCTHTASEDMAALHRAGGRACICPLTEGNLGDGIFDHLELCDGQACLGTDCNAVRRLPRR